MRPTSTWTYNWSNFPFGRHAIEVRATDKTTAMKTWTDALPFVGSKRFNEIPPRGRRGQLDGWARGKRAGNVVVDDGGSRYSLGPQRSQPLCARVKTVCSTAPWMAIFASSSM